MIAYKKMTEMIERYFDCTLSDAEEKELRSIIAATDCDSPLINEARALMGFRKTGGVGRRTRVIESWLPSVGIAAAIAVVISIGAMVHGLRPASDSTCIAYVNGQIVTDEEEVMRQLCFDLKEFAQGAEEATRGFHEELDQIVPMIDDMESGISMINSSPNNTSL